MDAVYVINNVTGYYEIMKIILQESVSLFAHVHSYESVGSLQESSPLQAQMLICFWFPFIEWFERWRVDKSMGSDLMGRQWHFMLCIPCMLWISTHWMEIICWCLLIVHTWSLRMRGSRFSRFVFVVIMHVVNKYAPIFGILKSQSKFAVGMCGKRN